MRTNREAFLHRFRIVVADDNAAFMEQLVAVLAVEFDVVGSAADGWTALDLVRRCMPDVVILDIHMPGLSGIEVSSQLASGPGKLPAMIVCSVESDPEVMDAARRAGALAYVHKSRIQRDLVLAVKSVLQSGGWGQHPATE
jgi:DNA-binding NarL/FixJ family response regulator